MSWAVALLLAVLQGVAEFLPISSSGHLALAQMLLPGVEPDVAFDVLLHMATLLAVALYFRRDLLQLALGLFRPGRTGDAPFAGRERRAVLLLGAATVVTVILALALQGPAEAAFHRPEAVGSALLGTALLLVLCRIAPPEGTSLDRFALWKALLVGAAQAVAIFPGVSRSGATIAACLLLGLDRNLAARFSLLLSLPVIFGAFLLKAGDLDLSTDTVGPLALAFTTALVVGYASIHLLMGSVRRGWFPNFAWYCAGLGLLVLLGGWLIP